MTDKISTIDVFRESIAFTRYKRKYIAGMVLLMFFITLPMEWSLSYPLAPGEPSPFSSWGFLVVILLATVIQAAVFNHFITALRGGTPSIIPTGLATKTLKVLYRELVVFLAVLLPGIIVMGLFFVAGLFFIPGDLESAEMLNSGQVEVVVGMTSLLGLTFGFGLLGLRWGAGMAGAAVGEDISLRQSWRMTKGHTFRLLVFLVPMIFAQTLSQLLFQPALEKGTFDFFSPGVMATTLVLSGVYWFSYVTFSVWYVRLKKRYDSLETAGTSEVTASGS